MSSERWLSGWRRRSRKPVYASAYRGFESRSLRHIHIKVGPPPSNNDEHKTGFTSRRCNRGEVPERFNGHAWKACVGANSPQVRILSSPPYFAYSAQLVLSSKQYPWTRFWSLHDQNLCLQISYVTPWFLLTHRHGPLFAVWMTRSTELYHSIYLASDQQHLRR